MPTRPSRRHSRPPAGEELTLYAETTDEEIISEGSEHTGSSSNENLRLEDSSSDDETDFIVFVKRVPHAVVPVRATECAAGFDLVAADDIVVSKGKRVLVSTGISVVLPYGSYGRIAPRSGLAWKHGIDVGAGVIDNDYRDEVKVLLFNFGEEDFNVTRGMRVAQLIPEQYMQSLSIIEDDDITPYLDTERGENGFGSTGLYVKK
jgi:dUTP pyrophosphatase